MIVDILMLKTQLRIGRPRLEYKIKVKHDMTEEFGARWDQTENRRSLLVYEPMTLGSSIATFTKSIHVVKINVA